MASSLDILTEACEALRPVIQKMFGGHGFFAPNGGMFAGIVTDDAIVLKLEDGPARDELLRLGGRPWTYTGQSKPMTMQNWIVVPEEFYDDYELLGAWARRARDLAPPKKAKTSSKASTKKKTAKKAVAPKAPLAKKSIRKKPQE